MSGVILSAVLPDTLQGQDWQTTGAVIGGYPTAPGPAFRNQTLTCQRRQTYPDAASYGFKWYVNSVVVEGNTLTGTYVRKGMRLRCYITPRNATGQSMGPEAQSPPVIVENSIPTITSVTLTPNPAWATSTLTCTPVGATDADGDAITFLYAWKVNGTAISANSSTLPPTSFVAGNTVSCTVTPQSQKFDPNATAGADPTVMAAGQPVTSNSVTPAVQRVTVSGSGAGAGGNIAATSNSANANCSGSSCSVEIGISTVTLTATASKGYRFAGWSGGCSGVEAAVTLTNLRSNVICSATFPARATITVSGNDGGAVAVTSTSKSATCSGSTCELDRREPVTLTATPRHGFVFVSWTGSTGCDSRLTTFNIPAVTMICTATFRAQ